MIIGMIRYAIPNAFAKNNSRNLLQLYEEPYFSDRFKIFCNITLESFKNQTEKNFILLVYHTNMIPNDKKTLFDNLEKQYPFIRNVYIDNQEMYIPEDLKTPELFTFRIDNDDGIVNNFIENLQKTKDAHKNEFSNFAINIPLMRQIMRVDQNNYATSIVNYVSNSMGLAYFGNDGRTIFDIGQHTEVYKLVKTFFIDGNGGLQIINGYNAANKFTKSQYFVGNNDSINKILSKEGYINVDLSCLPIIKNNSNIKKIQNHKKTWIFHK